MAKYLDPKVYFAFWRVFSKNKSLLISFLNALLPLENDTQIVDLEYLPAGQAPDIPGFLQHSILDIKCTDRHNQVFIVEIQILWIEAFNKDIVYNEAKKYENQLQKEKDYNILTPVYLLALTNKNIDTNDEFYHHYKICNIDEQSKTLRKNEIIIIELQKFKPNNINAKRMMILWLKFLTKIDEFNANSYSEMLEDENIAKALSLIEVSSLSDAALRAYDSHLDKIRVEMTLMNDKLRENKEEGKAEGIIEGEIKGKIKGKIEIVKNLISMNIPIEQISQMVQLPVEEIQRYLSE